MHRRGWPARLGLGEGISWLFASLALPSWPPRLRGGSGASRGGRGEPEGLLLVGSCPSPHWLGSLVAPEQGACWTCRGLGRRARSGLGGNMAPFLSHLAYVPQSILDSIAVLRMATCAHLCCGCRPVCSEDPTRPHGWKAEGKASFQPPPPRELSGRQGGGSHTPSKEPSWQSWCEGTLEERTMCGPCWLERPPPLAWLACCWCCRPGGWKEASATERTACWPSLLPPKGSFLGGGVLRTEGLWLKGGRSAGSFPRDEAVSFRTRKLWGLPSVLMRLEILSGR